MRPKHECVNHLGWLCVVSSCLIALAGHVWTRVETLVPMYPIYLLHLLTAVKAKELMLFACPKILIDQFLLEEMTCFDSTPFGHAMNTWRHLLLSKLHTMRTQRIQ